MRAATRLGIGLGVLSAIAATAFVMRRRASRVEHPPPIPEPLIAAEKFEKTLTRVESIAPFGLVVRVPSTATCEPVPSRRCTTADSTVTWSVVADPVSRPWPEGARPRKIGVFEGYFTATAAIRPPAYQEQAFDGWTTHPTLGRVRLHISVYQDTTMEHPLTEGLAVALTTTVAASGLPASLPTDAEIEKSQKLEANYATLKDDQSTQKAFIAAVNGLLARSHDLRFEGERFRTREPTVTALMKKRIDALLARATLESAEFALAVSVELATWDPAAGAAVLRPLLDAAGAGRSAHAKEAELGGWIALEVKVGFRLFTNEPELDATFAKAWASLDPTPMFDKTHGIAEVLLLRQGSGVGALLARWLSKPLPVTADHGSLSRLFVGAAYDFAPVRRRLIAALDDKTPYGTATTAKGTRVVTTPHGVIDHGKVEGPDGTTALRVCDLYAHELRTATGVPFVLTADVAARDKTIAAERIWLLKQP